MEKINQLYEKLKLTPSLNRANSHKDKEAYELAITLTDIGDSANEITSLIEEFSKKENPDDILEKLIEIGEELRHIVYHIRNSKFYDYIMQDDFSQT